ncbi:MAG: PfkB family carbohydrate kinase [Bacteroidales bacterium]|nr:PfkB family carbohydrate kinase [Bacteroidales bacterium]
MIYTIGETVIDLIFKDMQPQAAKVGGSALNTSVSLGRLGDKVSFISEIGFDELGDLCKSFLVENAVDTTHLVQYADKKTSLALAFLNEKNDAKYQFYKEFKDEMSLLNIDFKSTDYFLFSSSFSINQRVRKCVANLLHLAGGEQVLLYYDPNMRRNLTPDSIEYFYVQENFRYADLVHLSDEDACAIFGTNDVNCVFLELQKYGVKALVFTQNKNDVIVKTEVLEKSYNVPEINVVSTIGAGDTFNAGILHCLAKEKIAKDAVANLTTDFWDKAIPFSIICSSNVCQSIENYIDKDLLKRIDV